MRTRIRMAFILALNFFLIACMNQAEDIQRRDQLCLELPESFSTDDLIGTWIASYSLNDTDTIIINADGTYKQIYDDPDSSLFYESDWANWTIEFRESGYARLHLKGMRRAGEVASVFERVGGGVDPELYTSIDYCENEVVEMPEEIILIVTGASEDNTHGIALRQVRLAGSDWTWSFQYLDE